MSKAEIHYIIPEEAHHHGDTEMLFDAMGAYQDEIPFYVPQTAEIDKGDTDSVTVRLIRTSLRPRPRYELLEATEKMRTGVEKHFSDEDRSRLSQYFAGIAIIDALETE